MTNIFCYFYQSFLHYYRKIIDIFFYLYLHYYVLLNDFFITHTPLISCFAGYFNRAGNNFICMKSGHTIDISILYHMNCFDNESLTQACLFLYGANLFNKDLKDNMVSTMARKCHKNLVFDVIYTLHCMKGLIDDIKHICYDLFKTVDDPCIKIFFDDSTNKYKIYVCSKAYNVKPDLGLDITSFYNESSEKEHYMPYCSHNNTISDIDIVQCVKYKDCQKA